MAAKGSSGKNSVTVTGDMAKDGHVVVTINWFIDSAKYPGMNRAAVRAKVKNEIWEEMDDVLIGLTKNMNISYDSQNFTVLKEYQDLVEKRPNGTKLYAFKAEVQFDAAPAAPAAVAAAPAPKKESKGFIIEQRWNNDF